MQWGLQNRRCQLHPKYDSQVHGFRYGYLLTIHLLQWCQCSWPSISPVSDELCELQCHLAEIWNQLAVTAFSRQRPLAQFTNLIILNEYAELTSSLYLVLNFNKIKATLNQGSLPLIPWGANFLCSTGTCNHPGLMSEFTQIYPTVQVTDGWI